jgi:nicotinate-nucleotide adenylyltransferase
MHIALFFGSFNPIHLGHLSIAQHVLNECGIDQVHFVLSPHNPFKSAEDLWPVEKRWELLQTSIADNPQFMASDIELHLPTPSYTSQTLQQLETLNTGHQYSILMGSDSYSHIQQWKNPEHVLSYPILIYPRLGSESLPKIETSSVQVLQSPVIGFSATDIRRLLNEGKSVRYMVKDAILPLL